MKRFFPILMAALLLVAAIGCANAYANSTGEKTEFTSETAEEPAAHGNESTDGEPEKENAAPANEEPEKTEEEPTVNNYPIVTITMKDGGVMKLELYPDMAPNTVKNFIALANSGFYDGLTFHRIYAGFMIQGGDPKGNGTGGADEKIRGEFAQNGVDNPISHVKGVISMARAKDPDSASSQFFITVADATFLDGGYAAFGRVTEGMEIAEQIAKDARPVDNNGTIPPEQQPVIDSIVITD